jgi:hypothetical protein
MPDFVAHIEPVRHDASSQRSTISMARTRAQNHEVGEKYLANQRLFSSHSKSELTSL